MKTTENKPITELHAEHMEWLNDLQFYTDEIRILTVRVEEVAAVNSQPSVMARVEHFQNQLIMRKEQVDELNHAIRDHEDYLSNRTLENPVATDHRELHDHPKMRGQMETFEKEFKAMRKELYKFLGEAL